jgi:hypothetical protein
MLWKIHPYFFDVKLVLEHQVSLLSSMRNNTKTSKYALLSDGNIYMRICPSVVKILSKALPLKFIDSIW